MAMRPCSVCFRRFQGPASTAYVTILSAGPKWERKHRLCPDDYQLLVDMLVEVGGRVDYDDPSPYVEQPCLVCKSEPAQSGPHAVFVTAFPAKADREDFSVVVCGGCRPDAERLLALRLRPLEAS